MGRLITSQKAGIFAKLRDINIFNKVCIEYGAVAWPNEINLAPDAMYDEIKSNGVWTLKQGDNPNNTINYLGNFI